MLERVERDARGITLVARARSATGDCPTCGQSAVRVHGRYERRVRDVAVGASAAVIRLVVRRFLCENPACPAVTFAEQIPGLTSPHARFTALLDRQVATIGMALAGRAGSRLAARLGIAVSRHTLLRRVRAVPDPPGVTVPDVLGVDEFALRKGHVYASVMIDMATRRPVDIVSGRDATMFADWLRAHPGVRVICRDRAGGFADGGRTGAPDAIHVADRYHLWRNLGEAVERCVAAHRDALADPVAGQKREPKSPQIPQPPARDPDQQFIRFRDTAYRRHAQVHALLAAGRSKRGVARELGMGIHTVRRYAAATDPEQLLGRLLNRGHASRLDPYKPYLHQRLADGVHNGKTLHHEIATMGYTGSYSTLRDYLQHRKPALAAVPDPPPAVRTVTAWMMTRPDRLRESDRLRLTAILTRSPALDALAGSVRAFATMMVERDGHLLDDWITEAAASGHPPLAGFAKGLLADHDAVRNGLTLPWSSGACEGNVNRIKMIKRQMYGRANLDLLRIRTIHEH